MMALVITMLSLLATLCLVSATNGIFPADDRHLSFTSTDPSFRLGYLRLIVGVPPQSLKEWKASVKAHLYTCYSSQLSDESPHEWSRYTTLTYRALLSAQGKTLNEHAEGLITLHKPFHKYLSHVLNACSSVVKETIYSSEGAPITPAPLENMLKEMTMHASLALHPLNEMTVKNLAFELEWQHYIPVWVPLTLIEQSLRLGGPPQEQGHMQLHKSGKSEEGGSDQRQDPGLLLQRAFSCQTFFWDAREAFIANIDILARAESIIIGTGGDGKMLDPTNSVREIQLNPQYMGISPGIQAEAYGMCVRHLFPSVDVSKIGDGPIINIVSGTGTGGSAGVGEAIRLGIVSEHESNSSPGVVLTHIFEKLAQLQGGKMGTEVEGIRDYDLVFFRRKDTRTVFSAVLSENAQQIIELQDNPGNLEINRNLIADAQLDILVYIALPTEKFTSYLSHSRLAPVQVVFGIGHPLTSGIASIDYSIVAADMFESYKTLLHPPPGGERGVRQCMQAAVRCKDELESPDRDGNERFKGPHCEYMRVSGCAVEANPEDEGAQGKQAGGVVPAYYTEQLVVFDSLAYFLADHLNIYKVPIDPLKIAFHSTCAEITTMLHKWGLSSQIAAEELGCLKDSPEQGQGERTKHTLHLYACIQIPRKMHTAFDAVIVSVLKRDPHAKILMEQRVKQFYPRWIAAGLDQQTIDHRIILIPRMAHPDYLRLLSLSSVFLNTFPFGAGVTSSEAISVCIPVVVYAEMSSVLHLALAQVRKLGPRWEQQWVAHSVEQYVQRSIQLASISDSATTPRSENNSGSGETEQWQQYRGDICSDRHRLMGAGALQEATMEWDLFLKTIVAH